MKDVWYRAFADYTPTNYGGGTDEFFCIKVEDDDVHFFIQDLYDDYYEYITIEEKQIQY